MPEIAGIYDSGPITPIAKIKQYLSMWTTTKWKHFQIEWIEGIPFGDPLKVDMVAAAGATTIAANGALAKQLVGIMQLNDTEMFHGRFMPIEPVEAQLWQLAGTTRFTMRNLQARSTWYTDDVDPDWASTTFWVLGHNLDLQMEIQNPLQYALPLARVGFWGYRYLLNELAYDKYDKATQKLLAEGDLDTLRKIGITTTFLPAEGRSAA